MISVQTTPSYDRGTVQAAVDRHFDLLDLDRLIPREGKITVKPNLLMKRRPEDGTTAHPSLVEAVIRRVQKVSNAQITIADSPGGPFTRAALEGMTAALQEEYGPLPLLYAGGVMASTLIRRQMEEKFGGIFAEPAFSSDNAAGTAILAALAEGRRRA